MSDMNRERMLATLATLLQVYVQSGKRIPKLECDLEDGAVRAIRAIIENGPEVSREFVDRWEKEIEEEAKSMYVYRCTAGMGFDFYIINLLREAGVKVKEEK